jgi:hypothetical protein
MFRGSSNSETIRELVLDRRCGLTITTGSVGWCWSAVRRLSAGAEIAAKTAAELAAYGDAEIAQTDLPDVADAADSLADALRALNPPPEIESFHHAYIAYLQEYAHQLRSNTSGGGDPYAFMILLLMFGMPEVDLAYEQMSQEASAITEDCPAFQSAYDLLEPNLFASNTASPIA